MYYLSSSPGNTQHLPPDLHKKEGGYGGMAHSEGVEGSVGQPGGGGGIHKKVEIILMEEKGGWEV